MKRTLITFAALALASSFGARAEEAKPMTETQRLIAKDAQLAEQQLDQALAKGAPPPVVSAAPAGAVAAAPKDRGPQTVAVYGVDASALGIRKELRGYVRWQGQLYPAKVGGTIRGYTVASVTEKGTTLTRGKTRLVANLVEEDLTALPGQLVDPEPTVSRKADPVPAGVGAGIAPTAPQPQPVMPLRAPTMPAMQPAPFPVAATATAKS